MPQSFPLTNRFGKKPGFFSLHGYPEILSLNFPEKRSPLSTLLSPTVKP
ncbi:MAG: hypothetical protein HC786_26775 [Richelia sp. CSU_2_1]|nr:hypothetical protein [Microcoleus sp. SU_5_6]NJR25488.1 hypothetical protein [Richelia sp. CSU_2_1]